MDHFEMQAGQYGSLPARDGAGGFVARHKFLGIHDRPATMSDGQINVWSWSTSARLAARASIGGACSPRKARSASSKVWTTLTPSPPEVPLALSTAGKPIRSTHCLRASALAITSVFGARMPSCWASSINRVLA